MCIYPIPSPPTTSVESNVIIDIHVHNIQTSNKYLYGDRTIIATNIASSSNYPPNDILTTDIGEYKCMIVDPIVVVDNIKITKKKGEKKPYELNRHFQDN
jgi:hypothetical protein